MSFYNPPNQILDTFNYLNFNYDDVITLTEANKKYLKLIGGTLTGNLYGTSVYMSGIVDSIGYKLNGVSIDFSTITGITPGTISANKAVVVDSNKDASSFRNLGMSGTLSMSASSPQFNITNPLSCNQSMIWTSGSQPTNTNGIGIRFIGATSTGLIRSYNYVVPGYNNIALNDDAVYINAAKLVGINTNAPQTQLHVNGTGRITSYLQVGTSTDTTRMISCLDSGMSNASSKFITLGKANVASNQAEISYYHSSDGSTSNRLSLGLHTMTVMHICANGGVGIGMTSPEAGTLDCNSHINTAGAYRMDGTDVITGSRQFVGNGVSTGNDIFTTARVGCSGPLGMQIFNKDYNNAELRLYCGNLYAYCGNNNANLMYFGTNNEVFITCKKHSGGRKATTIGGATNDNYMLTVDGSTLTRYNSASYGWFNSNGNAGTGSDTVTENVAMYVNGRVLCVGEIDCISDKRRKSDIQLLDDRIVDRFIKEIHPKSFIYDKETHVSYGYIAQDILRDGFDDMIDLHPNEEIKEIIDDDGFVSPEGFEFSVRTGSVIPILHRKIQMMEAEIDTLRIIIGECLKSNKKILQKMECLDI